MIVWTKPWVNSTLLYPITKTHQNDVPSISKSTAVYMFMLMETPHPEITPRGCLARTVRGYNASLNQYRECTSSQDKM